MKHIMKQTLVFLFGIFFFLSAEAFVIVTSSGPGSTNDTAMRPLVNDLEKTLGVSVAIQNKPGAGGLIALRSFINGSGDILLGAPSFVYSHATNQLEDINPLVDIEPLCGFVDTPVVLYVSSTIGVKNLKDLQQYHKTNGRVLVGTINPTNAYTLKALSKEINVPFEFINYKQQADMAMNTSSGLIHVFSGGHDNTIYSALVEQGKLIPIAMISDKRVKEYPMTGTLVEQGYKQVPLFSWGAVYVRASMPKEDRERILSAILDAIKKNPNPIYWPVPADTIKKLQNDLYQAFKK